MVDQTDRHSKFVKLAKLILPVFAIILLVSIFALTKPDGLREGIIVSDSEMRELALGQKITNPRFSGLTDSGSAFTVVASAALPDSPKPTRIDLITPSVDLSTNGGIGFRSTAKNGTIEIKDQSASLTGNVTLRTTNGYVAQSEDIQVNLKSGEAISPGPVQVEGPAGSITAGQMIAIQRLENGTKVGEGVLNFSGGVTLIYLPSRSKTAK